MVIPIWKVVTNFKEPMQINTDMVLTDSNPFTLLHGTEKNPVEIPQGEASKYY